MKVVDKICQSLGFYSDIEEIVEADEPIEEIFGSKNENKEVKNISPIVNKDEIKPEKNNSKIAALFSNTRKETKVVDIPFETGNKVTVVILEAKTFDDSQKIADHLREKEAVLVKFDVMQKDVNRRIVDFVSGTIYALGGSVKKVGEEILVCAPKNVTIDPSTVGNKFQGSNLEKFNKGW